MLNNRADDLGYFTPTQECGPNGREPGMGFQMRNKTLTSSMAGALLVGGTLGVTGAADAGLSWTNVSSAMYVGLGSVSANASGATNSSGGSWLTQSAATSNGISWSGSNVTGGAQLLVSGFACSFTVSAPTSIVISGLAPASGVAIDDNAYSGVSVQLYGPNSFVWAQDSQDSSSASYSSGVLNLSAGSYTVQGSLFAAANSGYSGNMLDISVVPAPGALALLGVAGLIGGRRRRA